MKTKVIFRKFPDGEVIALFPQIPGSVNPYYCMSYMHTGQHGAASPAIVSGTAPTSPEDYADLKRELEAIGYSLRIVRRFMYSDLQKRRVEIKAI